jgi:hypothetical protein
MRHEALRQLLRRGQHQAVFAVASFASKNLIHVPHKNGGEVALQSERSKLGGNYFQATHYQVAIFKRGRLVLEQGSIQKSSVGGCIIQEERSTILAQAQSCMLAANVMEGGSST